MWWPYACLTLYVPSLLQMWDLSLLCYLFLLFSFMFSFCLIFVWSPGLGVGYSLSYISDFSGPAPLTKNKIKPLNTSIPEILFLMFCFGACTLTLSPGPHKNRNPKPSTLENRICLLHNALNPVLKCLFLQCFSNINQICPKNRPLTKMITLHNAQNKAECFRNGLLRKLKTFLQNTQLKKKTKKK